MSAPAVRHRLADAADRTRQISPDELSLRLQTEFGFTADEAASVVEHKRLVGDTNLALALFADECARMGNTPPWRRIEHPESES